MTESTAATRPVILRWLGAFTGFYRPSPAETSRLDPVSRFLYAARSVILVISAQAALIAGLLALSAGRFDPRDFCLVLIGFVAAHMISNLSNDYFGFRRGDDTPDSPRMRYTPHPMAGGVLQPGVLLAGLAVLAAIGAAVAAFFILERGLLAGAFVAAGVILLFAYDAAPVPLKSIGLGEIAVFVVWGPLMVGGGYAMMTGRLTADVLWASVPYGLGVMSILVGKHIDQLDFDGPRGIRTLPVIIGERAARILEIAAISLMYAVTLALILTGRITPFAAFVLIALPRATGAVSALARPRPESPPPGYLGWPLWYHRGCLLHNRLFGWLYILGLALGAIWPHLRMA
ncbi:MAG TPA: prenyltransferase [Gammaproteobacteria bacterium]|nr:prenyltransferase [Gammaproteobacteria bacterium]